MSERLPNTPEHHGKADKESLRQQNERLQETIERGRQARHEHAEAIDEIRHEVEKRAEKAEKSKDRAAEQASRQQEQPMYVNRELKRHAYEHTLRRTRRKLSAPDRALSRVVHNPIVESVSEVGAKTVARPSGVLAGGLMAFLGSGLFLWVTKHYGYEYNFLLFLFFFIAGFFIGLIIELIWRVVFKKRNRD